MLKQKLHKRSERVKMQGVTVVPAWLCSALLQLLLNCNKFSLKDLYDDNAMFDNKSVKFHSFYT
jgi:hypothetical protein